MSAASQSGGFDLTRELIQQSTVGFKVGQSYLVISERDIQLELMLALPKSKNPDRLWAIGGLALSLLAALVAADFEKFVLPATAWQTLFGLGLFLSVIWIIREYCRYRNELTVEAIVKKIAEGSRQVQTTSLLAATEEASAPPTAK